MAEFGIDAEEVSREIANAQKGELVSALFGKNIQPLSPFLDFRQETITQFIQEVIKIIRLFGLEVGLDCFTPSLTRMVGQDLNALTPLANWTKIMIYGHAYGPATLPFEFKELVKWFMVQGELTEQNALLTLSEITNLPLLGSLDANQKYDFSAEFLAAEINLGRKEAGSNQLLAGIELVEIPGASELNDKQIKTDLRAIQASSADGLSISWDLLHIPLKRLKLVQSVWL
jgi:hypothetical protein